MSNDNIQDFFRERQGEMRELMKKAVVSDHPSPREIIQLRRGTLPYKDHKAVEAHVVFCVFCAREYLALEALDERGDEQEVVFKDVPAYSKEEIEEIRRKIAECSQDD